MTMINTQMNWGEYTRTDTNINFGQFLYYNNK